MRTLIASAFVSVDGVVDSPGGGAGENHRSAGWTFKDIEFLPEAYELAGRAMQEASGLMLGRVSYEAFSRVWPDMEDFAAMKDRPKYVVSTTLSDDDLVDNWGPTTILRSLEEIAALKETDGGPIYTAGSARLTRDLGDAGLIDRYDLLVFPVLLGGGKRMFSESDKEKQRLRLVEHEAYANGIQKQVYEVLR